jgi:peptide/nickel transport system permease protein
MGGVLRRVGRSKGGALGLAGLASTVLVSLLAPVLPLRNPYVQDITRRLLPPPWMTGGSLEHLLGTDPLGRDLLARIIFGARVSLVVGIAAVALAGSLGTLLGLLAGYYGRRLDAVVMRLADVQLAFPFILLVITFMVILGPGLRNVILALGIAGWTTYARVVRAETLSLRAREFVDGARTVGASDVRILLRYVLPNVVSPVLVIASFAVASTIIVESSLSFLGLGVQPPAPTWGGILSDGRPYLGTAWWVAALPGLAITVTVLSINLVGDWLRDLLDPRLEV